MRYIVVPLGLSVPTATCAHSAASDIASVGPASSLALEAGLMLAPHAAIAAKEEEA